MRLIEILRTKIKASKKIEDWAIPFILMGISVVFALSYVLTISGFSAMAVWVGIMQGLAIAALEGYLYQVFRQFTCNRKQDKLGTAYEMPTLTA